ncbi:hypothetical protein IWX87_003208 [Polaromonas sp. CG_9.7]|nr:hypothetical protein [Polaromonas sp. CG_9.7]MBG6115380.1 hypothetical protein [Polaromonas sp. CG_9.2]
MVVANGSIGHLEPLGECLVFSHNNLQSFPSAMLYQWRQMCLFAWRLPTVITAPSRLLWTK